MLVTVRPIAETDMESFQKCLDAVARGDTQPYRALAVRWRETAAFHSRQP